MPAALAVRRTVKREEKRKCFAQLYPEDEHRCKSKHNNGGTPKDLAVLN